MPLYTIEKFHRIKLGIFRDYGTLSGVCLYFPSILCDLWKSLPLNFADITIVHPFTSEYVDNPRIHCWDTSTWIALRICHFPKRLRVFSTLIQPTWEMNIELNELEPLQRTKAERLQIICHKRNKLIFSKYSLESLHLFRCWKKMCPEYALNRVLYRVNYIEEI